MNIMSKTFAVILAFFLGVIVTGAIDAKLDDLTNQRSIIATIANEVDKVADNGSLSKDELGELYLDIASYGLLVDINVERKVKVVVPDGAGKTKTVYMTTTDTTTFTKGDLVTIEVIAVDWSTGEKISQKILHYGKPKFEFRLPARVRRSGA